MGETSFTFLYHPSLQELSCFLVSVHPCHILSETHLSVLCPSGDAVFKEPTYSTSYRVGSAEDSPNEGADILLFYSAQNGSIASM